MENAELDAPLTVLRKYGVLEYEVESMRLTLAYPKPYDGGIGSPAGDQSPEQDKQKGFIQREGDTNTRSLPPLSCPQAVTF